MPYREKQSSLFTASAHTVLAQPSFLESERHAGQRLNRGGRRSIYSIITTLSVVLREHGTSTASLGLLKEKKGFKAQLDPLMTVSG